VPSKGHGWQLARYDKLCGRELDPKGLNACAKITGFVLYASGSAEELWHEVENRLAVQLGPLKAVSFMAMSRILERLEMRSHCTWFGAHIADESTMRASSRECMKYEPHTYPTRGLGWRQSFADVTFAPAKGGYG
jgi:hypothetical protein